MVFCIRRMALQKIGPETIGNRDSKNYAPLFPHLTTHWARIRGPLLPQNRIFQKRLSPPHWGTEETRLRMCIYGSTIGKSTRRIDVYSIMYCTKKIIAKKLAKDLRDYIFVITFTVSTKERIDAEKQILFHLDLYNELKVREGAQKTLQFLADKIDIMVELLKEM